jgi:hypothetical protein
VPEVGADPVTEFFQTSRLHAAFEARVLGIRSMRIEDRLIGEHMLVGQAPGSEELPDRGLQVREAPKGGPIRLEERSPITLALHRRPAGNGVWRGQTLLGAKVEIGMGGGEETILHRGEHRMVDFQMGEGSAQAIRQSLIVLFDFVRNVTGCGDGAVSAAQQPEKERTAAVYLFQTDLQHLSGFCFRRSDAPAHVNIHELQPVLFAPVSQVGEDIPDQVVPFGMHVPKGRRDEYSDSSPPKGRFIDCGHFRTTLL